MTAESFLVERLEARLNLLYKHVVFLSQFDPSFYFFLMWDEFLSKCHLLLLLDLIVTSRFLNFCDLFRVNALLLAKYQSCNHGHLLEVFGALKVLQDFHENTFTKWMCFPYLDLTLVQVTESYANHLPVLAELLRVCVLQQELLRHLVTEWLQIGIIQWILSDHWVSFEKVVERVDEDLEAIAILSKEVVFIFFIWLNLI